MITVQKIAPSALKALDRIRRRRATRTDAWWVEPSRIFTEAGLDPDPWQQEVLDCVRGNMLLNVTRQGGKTHVVSAKAIQTAVLEGPALVLILSKSLRQAGELFRAKLVPHYEALGRPVRIVRETALQMELANGSRIISLPGNEATVRCYSSVALLILDEAARIPDNLFASVRPMLAVSKGRIAALSTPWGKRGFFYKQCIDPQSPWRKWRQPCTTCPRISTAFIEEERRMHGDTWVNQEYYCSFEDTVDAVFAERMLQAAVSDGIERIEL